SGPARVPPDAPRRKRRTQPPPPPGSPVRKVLEDKIDELREAYGDDDPPRPPTPPAGSRPPAPPKPPRTPPGQAPAGQAPAGKRPARAELDLSSLPEADRTKENRGAVGIKHDRNASLTANTASGTIGETPAPLFDRAAIAAGSRGALASERLTRPGEGRDAAASARLGSPPGDAIPPRLPERSPSGKASPAGTGPTAARGSREFADSRAARGATPAASRAEALAGLTSPSEPAAPGASEPSRLAVPVGEFDHTETVLEQDKRRIAHGQATIKRDAASALLGIAAPAPP